MKTIIYYFTTLGNILADMLQQRGAEILDDMRDLFRRKFTI